MIIYNSSWAHFKALKIACPTAIIYYIPLTVSPNTYQTTLVASDQFVCTVSVSADVTDFQTNYKAAAVQVADLDDAAGKINSLISTNVMKTGTLVTTSVTVNQVVLTYTVTAAKTLYVQYVVMGAYLTSQPANANPIDLGDIAVQTPSGTNIIQSERFHPKISDLVVTFPQAIPIAAGVVFRIVCNPNSSTSMIWEANFGGYER